LALRCACASTPKSRSDRLDVTHATNSGGLKWPPQAERGNVVFPDPMNIFRRGVQ
jgi:hypothetical protein